MRNGDTDRPCPHLGIVDDKPGDEILVFAGGYPVFETNANDLIAGVFEPVPRAMLGRKTIAGIFGWKRLAVVEGGAQRSQMGPVKNVGGGDLPLPIAGL